MGLWLLHLIGLVEELGGGVVGLGFLQFMEKLG